MTAGESLFDVVADELEARTALEALAARGTLRLVLKSAGLDAKTVTPAQMAVAIEKVLPRELESRGITDASGVCTALAETMRARESASGQSADGDSPEAIFRRMRQGSASAS